MVEKALLIVLDGFGLRDSTQGNAIKAARTPALDALFRENATTHLATSGEEVGLPAGQMGNSEVGHMNIGAGRIIYQMLTRIDKSVRDGDFFENPVLVASIEHALRTGGALHLLGLVSDGGVHSHVSHLAALLRLAADRGLPGERVLVHAFTDGRDTSPTGGKSYLAEIEGAMTHLGGGLVDTTGGRAATATKPFGAIATVSGRYYAMDRDKRWDRTKRAWDAIVHGAGERGTSAVGALVRSYEKGVTDEFVLPTVVLEEYRGVRDGDSVLYFNFRPDRTRQLTRAFTQQPFTEFETGRRPVISFSSMTKYDDTFTSVPFAFGDERPSRTMGEIVAEAGLAQLRVAETEKYPHVTFFFNGGEEKPFPREERALVQSPKDVPTYDHKPEMSAHGVAGAVEQALRAQRFAFVVVNFANCDMVGHTGDFRATVKAVETVDACLAKLLPLAREQGYHVFLTADHGNAEEMTNPDGSPQTAHTTLPVPFAHAPPAGGARRSLRPGILADVAPTMLAAMGLPQPKEMTGKSLFV